MAGKDVIEAINKFMQYADTGIQALQSDLEIDDEQHLDDGIVHTVKATLSGSRNYKLVQNFALKQV